MTRILCIGYSVTEGQGYIEKANSLAFEHGSPIRLVRSGWGGHSIHSLAYMMEEVLDRIAPDFVLLEPFAGIIRDLNTARIKLFLDEVLTVLAWRGLPVALLNVYQTGIDYRTDFLTRLGRVYRRAYGIPFLDVAATVAAMDEAARRPLFIDRVHVTPEGSELYGALVYDFLAPPPVRLDYVRHFRRGRLFRTIPVPPLAPGAPLFEVKRNGVPLAFVEIPEGASLTLDLGGPAYLESAMMVYGPRSGSVTFDGGVAVREVLPYDQHGYYVRSAHVDLKMRSGPVLTVTQSAALPTIPLLKGTPSQEPRRGYVSHLFARRVGPLTYRYRYGLARTFMTGLEALCRIDGWRGGGRTPSR